MTIHQFARRLLALAPNGVQQFVRHQQRRQVARKVARRSERYIRNGRRLVPEQALEQKYGDALQLLRERGSDPGDYLEFGVFNGSSLACMHRALGAVGADRPRLFGFDSFEGLPLEARHDDGGAWFPGQFSIDYEFTRSYLTEQGVDWNRVHLVKGWFSDTLTSDLVQRHSIAKASVIMVDCDMYLSAKQALTFCAPLIDDMAVIFFDDWHSKQLDEKNLGEKRAFDEFLQEHPQFQAEDFGSYNAASHCVVVTRV